MKYASHEYRDFNLKLCPVFKLRKELYVALCCSSSPRPKILRASRDNFAGKIAFRLIIVYIYVSLLGQVPADGGFTRKARFSELLCGFLVFSGGVSSSIRG